MINDYKNIQEEREPDLQYFCKFTFGQFFTILVLEVATLAFVFYLGAKYGTSYLKIDTADDQRSVVTEIVSTGGNGGQASSTATPTVSQQAIQDLELQAMARDALKGSGNNSLKGKVKELLDKQANSPVVSEPQQQTALPQSTIQQQQAAMQAAMDALNAEQAQASSVIPTPEPQPAQAALQAPAAPLEQGESGAIKIKSSAGAQYSIQVGSYPNMQEANSKVESWRGRGYPSFMMIADIPDRGRWYRVRIGGFPTKEDAQTYLEKFKGNEGVEAIVVLNEQ
ncbi:MAG: hypothetical protein COV46_06760 [Deltaproteobacteria bacterium CG11_big_fil_rev_8_21_14_0_20_49_13]|nr:MAG: hypothetical protein COV46_06760 [Deltaproteobacteria bacterium CG11_big_fil_rev_8_21_14_0_20_49_13]